jgi:ABC-type transport system involved in multi-copper enzyme maturation permease subunit
MEMINLIIKDFMLQKKYIYFAVGYGVFIFFAFQHAGFNNFIYSMGSIAISYIFIASAINHDEKDNANVVLISLPIKRYRIVLAKYITILTVIALSLAVMGLLGAVFKVVGFPTVVRFINISDAIITFVSVGLLSSVYYPINLKFGSSYLRIFNVFIFMLVFFLPKTIAELLTEYRDSVFVRFITVMKAGLPDWLKVSLAVVITLFIIVLSFTISVKIYNNKEF